jgi:hypothetical protein
MRFGKETVVRWSSFCMRSCNFLRNVPATTVELLGSGSSTIESFMGVEGCCPVTMSKTREQRRRAKTAGAAGVRRTTAREM